ncbi:uncharacterized protein LOC113558273 [Rhopalosiphum maidis]|uniref:uncharacterized protein LOC113558273 n=1 Tax=Rhopalosiphum maidis TaxID=43146 RepID=UPI000EFEF6C3|nr:uncharacterized protein LOC113558273 [Rhopalosiphum maidis]
MKKRPKDGLLILVRNIKLESLSPKKLRKKFICSSHFERNAYSNPTAPKSRLNRNAVPNKYLNELIDNIPEEKLTTEKSPINRTWHVSNQNTAQNAYIHVNETIITTPKKSHNHREKITDNMFQDSKSLFSMSPEVLKVKTPEIKYPSVMSNSFNLNDAGTSMFSPSLSITPNTRKYISDLTELPSNEISIKKAIEYNKALDIIEGYEDLGTLGRTNKIGSYALVIMIRCLYVNWKFPLCYFFTGNGIKGDNLTNILKECVIKLLELGLVPSAVVCDQGSQNRRMFSLLGATHNNPSVDINGQKLFLIYDMPHMIKSLRNNLLDASIKTCVSTGELKTKTALDTANFIENVNDMFDSANSKNLYDANPNRRPLSKRNSQVLQNLKNFCILFDKAVKINLKNNKVTTPPCFIGLKWTLTAIIGLYESEKIIMNQHISNKEYFLMTNKLTQDPLENMFSIMRQKNGYNKNPTARTFRCCFSAICSYSLMKCSESSNCEEDGEEFFNVDTLNDVQITRPTYSEEIQEDGLNDNIYNLSDDCETDSNTSSVSVEVREKKSTLRTMKNIIESNRGKKQLILVNFKFRNGSCNKGLICKDDSSEIGK